MAVHSDDESSTKVDNSKELPSLNILSIDFDWIMEPSIQIYNHLIHTSPYIWNEIADICPGVKLKCDYKKYEQLCIYFSNIIKTLKDKKNFNYGFDHHEILKSFKTWGIDNNQPYKLFNVDHHHDCGYSKNKDDKYEDIIKEIDCGNWVLHLLNQYPNCESYTWICNQNSEHEIKDDILLHLPQLYLVNDLNIINYIDFDYVFFCKSEHWVPPDYWPLYTGLVTLLDKFLNK